MFIIGTSGVGKSVTIKHLVGLLRSTPASCGSTATASTNRRARVLPAAQAPA
jgi:ABC-type glutathione transport system ATPase component